MTQLAKARATLALQQAGLHQAELNVSYTTITAPVDGTVGARTLRVGQYVQAGTQLMAVVPLQAVYVMANYKETQLTDVRRGPAGDDRRRHVSRHRRAWRGEQRRAGQRPGVRAAAAGQRDRQFHQDRPAHSGEDHHRSDDPLAGLLRPGMSVEPTIDTKHEDMPSW